MRALVFFSAALLAMFGFVAGATSPNPSDHFAGKVIVAIAIVFALLAWFAPPKITAWVFFGSIALVVVAYKLPMSFWRAVGLARETPSRTDAQSPGDNRK